MLKNINIRKINYIVTTLELLHIFKEADYETMIVPIDNPALNNLILKLKEDYPENKIEIIFRLIQYIGKYGIDSCLHYISKINALGPELSNAYEAADTLLLFKWFKEHEPSESGFIFDGHQNLKLLWKKMEYLDYDTYGCHSGASMCITIKSLSNICKKGKL